MTEFDVVGLGVSTLDLVMLVDQLPGSELVQRAHQSLLQGGGPVATALVALARLGCRTAMLDCLGDDWRADLIRCEFEREGVLTRHLSTAKGCSSSIASILVRRSDGARAISYAPGDAPEYCPDQLPRDAIRRAKVLHLNGRHPDAALAAARFANKHGVLVSFDGGAHRYREELRELIGASDLCIVARQFAQACTGAAQPAEAAALLHAMGPKTVVITAGVEGSWVSQGSGPVHQPAFLLDDALDSTGAGDAYHGAFLYALLQGQALSPCASFASAVAALNTRGLGGRSALPTRAEAEAFLAERRDA
jgi:sugar/nucleoside kinase (ribokinase family)